jgi:septal ring-binding cell division protein DamX
MATRAIPVALPAPEPAPVTPSARLPGGAPARPLFGPVIPLTASTGGGDELLGGGPVRGAPTPVAVDPVASRVLTKGEPIAAPSGRADDFGWPRNSAVTAEPASTQPPAALVSAPVTPPRAAPPATAGQRANAKANANTETPAEETKPPVRRRPPPVRTDNNNNNAPRPPLAISPSAAGPGGWWR